MSETTNKLPPTDIEQKDIPKWEDEFDNAFPEGESTGYNSYPFPLSENERESIKEFIHSLLTTRDEALTNAIMEAAHREDHFTTHKLATILKDLVPTFNYHAYRGKLRQEGRTATRDAVLGVMTSLLEEMGQSRDFTEEGKDGYSQALDDVEQLLNNKALSLRSKDDESV